MEPGTSRSPIDVDLQERGSDNSGDPLDLDAEIEGAGDPDLGHDKMDEDEGSPPPADRSDLTRPSSMGHGHGPGGSHSQHRYHPHYHG